MVWLLCVYMYTCVLKHIPVWTSVRTHNAVNMAESRICVYCQGRTPYLHVLSRQNAVSTCDVKAKRRMCADTAFCLDNGPQLCRYGKQVHCINQ